MKKSIRNILCCGALFCTLTLTSCFDNPDGVKSVVIENGKTEMFIDETYDYSNLTLNITKNNGETEIVNVTEDMIVSKPDFSTVGKKYIVIQYEGKEYRLTVNVVENPVGDVFYNKIQ
ncbi:MAG: bacterial Ig-like domain-containing protein, partial [Christensenellales bacterium]